MSVLSIECSAALLSFKYPNIRQTRDIVYWDIHIPRRKLRRAAESNFDEIRDVWISDETLFRVYISSQSKLKLRSKRKNKIVKNLWLILTGIQTSSAIVVFFAFKPRPWVLTE